MSITSEGKGKITFWLLVVALIFIYVRPYEIVPFIEKLKITKVALAAALIFSFLEKYRRGFLFKEAGFRLFFFLQALAIALVPISIWPANSLDFWIESYLKAFLVFYLILIAAEDHRKLDTLIKVIFVSCSFIAARVLLAFGTGNIIYDYDGTRRISGISILSSGDPNDLALALAMAVPIGLYLFYASSGFIKKAFYGSLILVNMLAVLFTGSRGGYLGLMLGLMVFLLIVYKGKRTRIVLAGLVAGAAIFASVPDDYRARFLSTFDSENYAYSESGRVGIWKRGLKTVMVRPQGVGIANYTMTEGMRKREAGSLGRWHVAHNSYLQVAVELGVIGFILYGLLLFTGLKTLKRIMTLAKEVSSPRARLCACGFVASLVAFIISSFFLSQAYYWNHYIFIGLIIAMKNILERTKEEQLSGCATAG